jgi:hypothetical protein
MQYWSIIWPELSEALEIELNKIKIIKYRGNTCQIKIAYPVKCV